MVQWTVGCVWSVCESCNGLWGVYGQCVSRAVDCGYGQCVNAAMDCGVCMVCV